MVRFRLLLSAALLAIALPSVAAARGIPIYYGTEETMAFVANTEIGRAGSKPLSLCHYYETRTLYWLGWWIDSNGYVLSDSDCQGQTYIDDPALIQQAFASGALEGIPPEPVFTLRQRAEGHAWFGIGALLLVALLAKRALSSGSMPRRKSRMEERMEVLGLPDNALFRFIDAMLHAANADGKADPAEVAFIREKATEVAQLDYSEEHIEWAISHTDRLKTPRDFQRFGRGLTPEQSRMVLRAALAVVASDGQMTRKERRFIASLTAGLMLDAQEVDRILSDGSMGPAAAAAVA